MENLFKQCTQNQNSMTSSDNTNPTSLPSEEEIRNKLEEIWNQQKKEYNENPNNERRIVLVHSCNKYGTHSFTPFEPLCDGCDCDHGRRFHEALAAEAKNFLKHDTGTDPGVQEKGT